jgi:hypothetical protein
MKKVISIFKRKDTKTVLFLFAFLSIWRLLLIPFISASNAELWNSNWLSFWWGGFYQIISIVGGFLGLMVAKHWGGFKSILGRAIYFISFGLLLQAFGQSVATYYIHVNIQGLYPSIADVGFFGSVLMYICGIYFLAKATKANVSLKSFSGKTQIVVIPLILLIASYLVFLRGYEFDWTNKLKIFLDFGYPFGQALYVSLAILTLSLSRKFLGGIMKAPIVFILCAFLFQYLSDYSFLYLSSKNAYIAGGFVDVMYMISYFLMSIAILQFDYTFEKIKNG